MNRYPYIHKNLNNLITRIWKEKINPKFLYLSKNVLKYFFRLLKIYNL